MTTQSLFINLIRYSVCGEKLDNISKSEIGYQALYSLAKSHDLTHIVSHALEKNGLLPDDEELAKSFKKQKMLALYRIIQFDDEIAKMKNVFSELGVKFILLKGSVLRSYYPERWMRTSCDVDILVDKPDFFKVSKYLVNQLGYKKALYESHDVSMFSPEGAHLELHYALLEDNVIPSTKKIFKSVWDYASCYLGYEYVLSAELFYLYHIAHMAKHIRNGGCGVRPFIDLWVLKNVMNVNADKCRDLLENCELSKLADNVERLTAYWFDGAEGDDLTQKFAAFIIRGGVFGNEHNRAAITAATKTKRPLWSYIWKPYDELIYVFPSLEGRKLLLPFYEVARWFKLVFNGAVKKSIARKKIVGSIDEDSLRSIEDFVKRLGIK